MNEAYDIVIVGGGTSGCVLAARLSADGSRRVLLLETGGRGKHPLLHIPVGFTETVDHPRFSFRYETEPVTGLSRQRLFLPRGKGLGGSSAINGMIYVRGQREDFDDWCAQGNPGWSADDLAPYFRRAFHQTRGEDAHHGTGGPIVISDCARDPLSEAFVDAARSLGFPDNSDFNGASQEGVGYYQFGIDRGRRSSAFVAYLAPARTRRNLRIVSGAHVLGIELEGQRAVGVRYRLGQHEVVARAAEVVLAAGAINSPQLLMLSGIGPAEALRALSIPVVKHLPGVGKNLQDHLMVQSSYRVHGLSSMNRLRSPLAQLGEAARFLLFRTGALTQGPCTAGLFFRTRPELVRPDAQLHFVPCSFDVVGRKSVLHPHDGMTAGVYQLRPESRGHVSLASRDPHAAPEIHASHLDTELDRQTLVRALRVQREIFRAEALERHRGVELAPGSDVQTDDEWLSYARRVGQTSHHPVGTCRMGPDDGAVVDARLRVHGIEGLRVVDASIMPALVSGNTHAATIVIAERATDLILEDLRHGHAGAPHAA